MIEGGSVLVGVDVTAGDSVWVGKGVSVEVGDWVWVGARVGVRVCVT